jgi:IS30 family transposase
MKYKQLTEGDRYTLAALKRQGLSFTNIAKAMNRDRSTIYREVNRNSCWIIDDSYRPSKAQRRTKARRSRSRRNQHFTQKDYAIVRRLLHKQWSPEQITGHLKQQGLRCFSHETIYRYIWRDKKSGGKLWKQLRCANKQRRKRYKAYDSRGRLAGKRNIADRPAEVETRKTQGHWEIDTVMGKGSKHCIVTLVERKTGYTLIGQLNDRTTKSTNTRTIKLMNKMPRQFKTITSDNGTEFHQYKKVEEATNCPYYFANPHHSWERGTNENTNGLIRQYLVKGTSMKGLTQQRCNAIAAKLNTRPRKILGYKTPEECFNE